MLGEFVIKILVLVLGYVYPALECFKTIERNRTEIHTLRFWCQYWVILAMLTAVEKFGDIFISWLPLYGEVKLAFIVYLWHPRTMGTTHVYDTLLRPFMAQHETDIERKLQIIMSKSIDLFLFYIKHFADKGQSMAFEILQYIVNRPIVNRPPRGPRPPPAQNMGRSPDNRHPTPAPAPAPTAPPLQPTRPPQATPPSHPSPPPPYRQVEPPRRTPLYPTVDQEDDTDFQVNRVEEALRAAGVNLRRLRQPPQ